jgi:hypothetical protein
VKHLVKYTDYKINKILLFIEKRYRIKISKKLSSGDRGFAYLTNDNKVLKITKHVEEVNFYKLGISSKNIVKCYNLYYLNKFNCWVILMDYIIPLSKEDIQIFTNLFIKFLGFNDLYEGKFTNKTKLKLKNFCEGEMIRYKKAELICYGLSKIYKICNGYNLNVDEVHADNLGWKNDEMVAFDLTKK